MPVALTELIVMNTAINEVPRPRTFLRQRLFGGRESFKEAYKFQYDAIQGKKKRAPFVSPEIGFKHVQRAGYKSRTYGFPLIAPLDILTETQVAERMAGEIIGGGMTPEERQTRMQTLRMAVLDDMITRSEEAMIGEALVSGVMTIQGDGVDDTISLVELGWSGPDDITDGAQDWDAAAPAPSIPNDIRTWKRAVYAASGIVPDTLILGEDAANAFLDDTSVLALLDKQRLNVGEINYREQDGAEYFGRLYGVDIFGYDDGYVNDLDVTVNFINPQYAVMCCSAARVVEQEMVYGPYHDVVSNQTFLQSRIIVPGEGDSIANIAKAKMVARPVPFFPYVKAWKSVRVID